MLRQAAVCPSTPQPADRRPIGRQAQGKFLCFIACLRTAGDGKHGIPDGFARWASPVACRPSGSSRLRVNTPPNASTINGKHALLNCSCSRGKGMQSSNRICGGNHFPKNLMRAAMMSALHGHARRASRSPRTRMRARARESMMVHARMGNTPRRRGYRRHVLLASEDEPG